MHVVEHDHCVGIVKKRVGKVGVHAAKKIVFNDKNRIGLLVFKEFHGYADVPSAQTGQSEAITLGKRHMQRGFGVYRI